MDIVVSSQMLADPGEAVLILPAATRYEIPGGVTETSTERRVILSPEIPGPRIGEARPEWEVLLDLAARVRPELAHALRVAGTPELRAEIAEAVPLYAPIADLREGGDSFQYGGPHYPDGADFPTEDGRAHFRPGEAAGAFRARRRRLAPALDSARQAVQLHGPGVEGLDHRRDARGGDDRGRGRGAAWGSRGRGGDAA